MSLDTSPRSCSHRSREECQLISEVCRSDFPDRNDEITGRIRILEVVPSLGIGGLQLWLLAFIKRRHPEFSVDIASCSNVSPYKNDPVVAGVGFFPCGRLSQPFRMLFAFWQLLRSQRRYDIVHSHVHRYNGVFSMIAALEGVPVRISHSHTSQFDDDRRGSVKSRAKTFLDRILHKQFVTHRLACSVPACRDVYGEDFPVKVLHCGIDLDALRPTISRDSMRNALGIDKTAFVVGHVGRYNKVKNQVLFERIARVLHARVPNSHFVIVGDDAIVELFEPATYGDAIHVVGLKTNVANYLQAMDVFLFPSRSEGLSLALLEAQAMGLPCVYSDGIPEEAEVCRQLMYRIPLDAPLERWVDAVELAGRSRLKLDRESLQTQLRGSSFDIVESVKSLEDLYRGLCCRRVVAERS